LWIADLKIWYQFSFNPPLPVYDRKKITKVGKPYLLSFVKGGWEGFYERFFKVLKQYKI
jgi:hypothetical protein